MKTRKFKESALIFTISTLCCYQAQAETGYPFLDDASTSGKLRTVYYHIDNTEKPSRNHKNLDGAWTAALWLDVNSGYYNDLVAIGASAYGVTKLDTLNHREHGSKQLLLDNNKGYSKLGQIWADFKFGDKKEDMSGHLKAGRQIIYTGLVSSSSSRSAPTIWQGFNFESSIYNTAVKLVWVNEIILRNDDELRELVNFEQKKIDYIWGAELSHEFMFDNDHQLKLKYRNAISKDFLQAHNIDVKWSTPIAENMDFSLNGKVYYAKKDGDLWTGKVWGDPAFDDDATVTSLSAEFSRGPWTLRAAVTKTKAESKLANTTANRAPGKYYYDLGKNTHGIFDIPTSAVVEDFDYNDELAWMLGLDLDMTAYGAPGLKLGYAFIKGDDFEVLNAQNTKESASEHEHDLLLQYAFPEPVKGLSFKMKYSIYRSDDALKAVTETEKNDLRAWLDYNFVLF